jgi:hypothetical protein
LFGELLGFQGLKPFVFLLLDTDAGYFQARTGSFSILY